jgi:hypothetical protein
VRRETGNEFTALRGEIKEGFDNLQRLMIQFMGIAIVALAGVIATLVGVIVTALL